MVNEADWQATSEAMIDASMSLRCLLEAHSPSLSSIVRRQAGYSAVCEACARPLERTSTTCWVASAPLSDMKSRSTG